MSISLASANSQIDFHITSWYSLAKIWKAPVRKKRPPFWRVKSWQKNRKRDRKLKMIDRIMRAWTAWIQTEKQKAFQNISAFPYSGHHLGQFELCRNQNLCSWHFKWTRMHIKQVIISFLIYYSRSITTDVLVVALLHWRAIGDVHLDIQYLCIIDRQRWACKKNKYWFPMNSCCCI